MWGSAPLHGGDLIPHINDRLADYISSDSTSAQTALKVAASTPGLTGLLLSTTQTRYWYEAADTVASHPLSPLRLKEICDLLSSVP
ncbi:hypothetical protein [Nocardiopsis listeri]|uniref:hypothetical protein n=1 Tax=Nocardiopsis listeri TaxID=53440 RepID=UPI000834F713|nr:hypothetical protein [Nocardiopsis listeri]